MRNDKPLADIPGVCGIVDGSILPGYFGIEAGQSAVGDIFLWFVNNLVPADYGRTPGREVRRPGEGGRRGRSPARTGCWRSTGTTATAPSSWTCGSAACCVGQTLHTEAHEIYRALIEATAFGALTIIDRIEEYGVPVKEIVNCGGLAVEERRC